MQNHLQDQSSSCTWSWADLGGAEANAVDACSGEVRTQGKWAAHNVEKLSAAERPAKKKHLLVRASLQDYAWLR
jgi:hypothetical protein